MRKRIKNIVSAPSGELIPLDLERRAHAGSSLRAFGRSEHEQAENVAELLKSIHTSNWKNNEILKEAPSMLVQLNSGENLTITNRDIVWWNGPDCEFYEAWTDGYYVYLVISHAFLQAGSLGIWCPNKCDWLFTKRADWFCIDAIIYIPDKNVFYGYCQWETPMHAGSGISFFQIDSLGTFSELQKIPRHTAHSQAEKSINCSSIYGKKYFGYSSEVDIFFLSSDQSTEFFKLEHAWQ